MKKLVLVKLLLLLCFSANAGVGSLAVFKCVIEDLRMGSITVESLSLEHGAYLYAPAFNGDIAAGSGAVKLTSRTEDDMVFIKSEYGDTTTITLTATNTNDNQALTNYKYVEKLDAEGVMTSIFRTGFCTGHNVK